MKPSTLRIRPAVMTSSSERALPELFSEVRTISGVDCFDLMVPRRGDLPVDTNVFSRMSAVMADEERLRQYRKYFIDATAEADVEICALATYFPDITSESEQDRNVAIQAVVNVMRLAMSLADQPRKSGECRMRHPIVEIVCGTIVDPPPTAGPDSEDRDVWSIEYKRDQLCRSLARCVEEIRRAPEAKEVSSFALALEMEPGETYVLNSEEAMLGILKRIEGRHPVDGLDCELLQRHVGFNVDIAHLRIERIPATVLETFRHRIVHAHISDHPRMHTHDQHVGSWTNSSLTEGGYSDYLRQLLLRAEQPTDVPFSGGVAVELEGCNRILWIHESLTQLQRAIAIAQNRLD
jgi:sugar phosphate isomerase/epimerase